MSTKSLFKGSCVALITPFTEEGVNFEELERLIEFQIKEGTDAILMLGTTGEPSTMSDAEKQEVIKFAVKRVAGRVPVIAGAGGNNTQKVITDAKKAEELGADGLLLITPYYNKCTQGGLVEHFTLVAGSTGLPAILYNVPSRTGVNLLPSTLDRLADHENIWGIKEACCNFEQICEAIKVCQGRIEFYSGDDAVTYPTMAMGGSGVISVTANVIPRFMKELTQAWFDGEIEKAQQMHFKLLPFAKACFIEVNPIPVKAAAEMMGLCSGRLRLPLTEIEPANRQKLEKAMRDFGLIS